MNIGGDPGWDEYGLPPVDIEIPDDARELDREVLAYHRELRAQRWRRRTRLLQGPMGRDGMVLPLLAGCLALTLLAGTLLTVFSNGPMTRPAVGRVGRQLPSGVVLVGGDQTPLSELHGLVLALIPPRCRCAHLRQLAAEAHTAGVHIYLVGTHGIQVTALAKQTGLSPAYTVEDVENALASAYRPVTLTAVLVSDRGSVTGIVRDRGQGFKLASQLRSLVTSVRGVPHPGASATASVAAGPAGN